MTQRRAVDRATTFAMLALVLSAAWVAPASAQDANACDVPGEYPDVIVGRIDPPQYWGEVNNISAYSLGTVSCNVGTCWLNWQASTANHPVIAQNLFRLKDGRFEQLGQSWLKHGFLALSGAVCSNDCLPTDGSHLGVNCSDPYWAGLNGEQYGLGPKFEVNASTGEFPYPATDLGMAGNAIYKRLQVANRDLQLDLNAGALYFAEAQYVTADDAAAGRGDNNASYAPVTVTAGLRLVLAGPTVREQPAIAVWPTIEPDVRLTPLSVPGDGLLYLASKATPLAGGYWHYEYALHNLNSHRSVRSFEVPIPSWTPPVGVEFHDVPYHSGEPFDGTDWSSAVQTDTVPYTVQWATEQFVVDPDANALRWGTLYNFRFDIKAPPTDINVTLGLFRPGASGSIEGTAIVPDPCNGDGVCDPGETCDNCPADCLGQGGGTGCCRDGVCDPGELPCTCEKDCGACVVSCVTPAECDDGEFCNGAEQCSDGFCAPGADPCGGDYCDEKVDACFECLHDDVCDDGVYCNGYETCADQFCIAGTPPCGSGPCDEPTDACLDCALDEHCDDGLFCNGAETCVDGSCVTGEEPCPDPDEPCVEEADVCLACTADCDDGLFCTGVETCFGDECMAGADPCPGRYCDEPSDACLGNVDLQPRAGMPLLRMTAEELERFELGRAAFETALDAGSGLGPIFNAASCAACHGPTLPGAGSTASVTHFGFDDPGGGGFDPLADEGGSLLQSQALAPECVETVSPIANVTAQRVTTALFGAGLVEAVADADIEQRAIDPPSGLSGEVHWVVPLDAPATLRAGRFGWKAQRATLLSAGAESALDQLGLTNRLLPLEHAPNGDAALLSTCDAQADPEDGPDADGFDLIDRVADYARYLAPPPQTPRGGLLGEVTFDLAGCAGCHRRQFVTPDDPALSVALRTQGLKPYSDFLLHDMAAGGDGIGQGGAAPERMRTAPLWGLRNREALWHDGRIAGGTFESRVLAAIAEHDVEGGEARASAQSFFGLPAVSRNTVVVFLDSLGRAEFDHDGDGDVDHDDWLAFEACFTGPGDFYDPEDACSISDVDSDHDVDDDDFALFLLAAEGAAGRVPDGAALAGKPLRLGKGAADQIVLAWDASCSAEDDDYEIYEGSVGDFASHIPAVCNTGGATSFALTPRAGDRYYLVVPANGFREGSYGSDSAGVPRPAALGVCLPQSVAGCP